MQTDLFIKCPNGEVRELSGDGHGMPQNYRNSDPESSEQAAKHHEPKRGSNCAIILELFKRHEFLTSLELWGWYRGHLEENGIDRVELSRRLSDLGRMGQIEQGEVRVCRVSGKKLASWELSLDN